MNQTRFFVLAMVLSALIAPLASAQTVASVSVVNGNGQLSCFALFCGFEQLFQPLTVKVADVNGNPISNAVVTWTVISGFNVSIDGGTTATSLSDADGLAFVVPFAGQGIGTLGNAYAETTITAAAGSAIPATFTIVQALPQQGATAPPVIWDVSALQDAFGNTVKGTASSPASLSVFGSPLTIRIGVNVTTGGPVPNVSVRLVNGDGSSGPSSTVPSIYCATGAGADPYSVLTDNTGYATCSPVFGGVAGTGLFAVLVGGDAAFNAYSNTEWGTIYSALPGGPQTNSINMVVSPAVIGSVTPVSGNAQNGTTGQALGQPLVVTVTGPSGNVLSGQTVIWSVSPTSAGIFGLPSTTTGTNGQASNTFTIAGSFTGTFTIKATAATNSSAVATFSETSSAPVTVTGITPISGNNQSALVNAAFTNPLVVQVNSSTGAPAVNTLVTFTVTSGSAVLSASSLATNNSGQAQVTVTAGSTLGTVNVTATAAGFSTVFTLAVISAAPTFTAANFYNGADFQRGSISPCAVVALEGSGIAPTLSGSVASSDIGALPYTLSGYSLTVNGAQAPIYSVSNTGGLGQVNFQLPCSVAAGTSVPVTFTVSGSSGNSTITVLPASPGVFYAALANGTPLAIIERPDGSFASPSNPARAGETVIAYTTGLGPTVPSVGTDALPIPGTPTAPTGSITVGVNNAGVPLISAQLSPDLIGVSEVTFQIPSSLASTTGSPNNVVFSIGVTPAGSSTTYYSAGTYIPIQ